ncbi:MAG: ACP S-malonyltransferase [Rickettsiales bacterium]|jgi:[acyl-carrier-protein] S-malonyltransferase|nr:ACP S-malonyltransferase [Rickettsiales bacterium]
MKAFLFPGQGSQKLKMGMASAESFAEARAVFDEVDEALHRKLSAIIFGDDADELSKTENTQPALLVASIATLRAIEGQSGKKASGIAGYALGHSLGEYTALVAAGAISLADGAKLLERRARAMAAAVPAGSGAMMAVIGLSIEQAMEIEKKTDGAYVANDNCPGQVVMSGRKDAIGKAEEEAMKTGARKCVILPVSVPAHCPLMAPAKAEVEAALGQTALAEPALAFISNRTAALDSYPAEIKKHLAEQMTSGVRFRECVEFMAANGVAECFELGSGGVLSGLVKRTSPGIQSTPIDSVESIEAFVKSL